MSATRSLALLAGLVLGPNLLPPPSLPAGTIQGTVRSDGGQPIAGVQVTVDGRGLRAATDTEGRFTLSGLEEGEVHLTARAIGYEPARRAVRVVSGRVTSVSLTLRAAPVRLDELAVASPSSERDAGRIRIRGGGSVTNSTPEVAAQTPPPPPALQKLGDRGLRSVAYPADPRFNTEEYGHFGDNSWASARTEPLSTFSIDVDNASYANVRRFLKEGRLPPKDAVRVEEMINYFRYDYPFDRSEHPFSVATELAPSPWTPGNRLALIRLQSTPIDMDELPATNLVFLLDVSGSMNAPNKLPLVKQAFRMLVERLREQDRVAIVVYAGAAGLVLPPTSGDHKHRILEAIDRLQAGGSTAGGAGIQLAYQVAREQFIRNGNNRVILATDGDFNVGASSEGELVRMIEARRKDGIFLTVLGFGSGNLKDAKMEQLADKGNGHYAYIDDYNEARKVFVEELGATLLTVAKDVKLQVEFNPARVRSYRLVGYENRLLAARDFNDDTKDAGEMGAGHAVTALYEIEPVDRRGGEGVDPLKYQDNRPTGRSGDWFTVKIRYKDPAGTRSRLLERVVKGEAARPSADFRFAAAVAEFGMLLRDSEHKGRATWRGLMNRAEDAVGRGTEDEYRAEFLDLVRVAARLASHGDRDEGGW